MNTIEKLATAFIIVVAIAFAIRLVMGIVDGGTLFLLIVGIMAISGLSLYQENNRLDKMARGFKL